jgi:hypothetical protein
MKNIRRAVLLQLYRSDACAVSLAEISMRHGAHQNPMAIEEVRRILILNVGLANRGKTPANDPSDFQ